MSDHDDLHAVVGGIIQHGLKSVRFLSYSGEPIALQPEIHLQSIMSKIIVAPDGKHFVIWDRIGDVNDIRLFEGAGFAEIKKWTFRSPFGGPSVSLGANSILYSVSIDGPLYIQTFDGGFFQVSGKSTSSCGPATMLTGNRWIDGCAPPCLHDGTQCYLVYDLPKDEYPSTVAALSPDSTKVALLHIKTTGSMRRDETVRQVGFSLGVISVESGHPVTTLFGEETRSDIVAISFAENGDSVLILEDDHLISIKSRP